MIKTICPECGEADSISRYRDSRYWRNVVGVAADGTVVINIDREYEEGLDDGYRCGACGEEPGHDSIVKATLRGTPFEHNA